MAKLYTIAYVGKKPERTDTVAGTGLVWTPDTQHDVSEAVAAKLLEHPDIWACVGEKDADVPAETPAIKEKEKEEPFAHVNLADMSKAKIADYAARTFNVTIDSSNKTSKQSMIDQVINLQNSHRQGE